ncbi:NmrA family NAD(P)-binding protein [Parahaliea mediterranea]|uniref:NmrA family NAD(P)-binding protein n=1 Tax=Parahaliea mediterranea TaxID=651086 RepID=UPI001300AA81|nr:NmrA family NAD(P)-binding protein [Parahaliea mediterranea]
MAAAPTLLVMGARGQVGSAVLAGLLDDSVNRAEVRVIAAHSGSRALPAGCDLRCAPLDDSDALLRALEGVDRAFLMVPFGAAMVERGARFVEAARQQGVGFIVRLSGLAAGLDSASAMGRWQGAVDAELIGSGIDYCILRCNSFMQNFAGLYRPMLLRGRLALAQGAGRSCFIDTEGIGRAAATVLLSPAAYSNTVLDLHGPEALDNGQAVAIIGAASGRAIEYRPISEARARAGYQRAGLPDWEVDVFASLDRFLAADGGVGPAATLRQLLGREPTCFSEFSARRAALWRA